jgi:16S rRNA (uracil1498-N3)-methyltransferase
MAEPRFYTRCTLHEDRELQLEAGPSQHIARTLRMQPGDELVLFDGRGGEYPAHLTAVEKRSVSVRIGRHRQREVESPLLLHLGIAMSRGDRMDLVVQKATELGVTRITPLLTERTELRLNAERARKKLEHWQRVAISACEQCGRNRIPVISAVAKLSDWLADVDSDIRLVLHHRSRPLDALPRQPRDITLLVGPEGGLAAAEIQLAEQRGFQALSLGPRILRTETAPLVALSVLQSRWGDMPLSGQ